MSSRAIAPIVGVSDRTVSADMKAQVRNDFAPAPLAVDTSTGEITETAGPGLTTARIGALGTAISSRCR